jgi:fatty-acyl-CoA synthase
MQRHPRGDFDAPPGLLTIEDCVDAQGHIAMPPGTTLISLLERNVASVGDTVAYRFLDFARAEGRSTEITWTQLDTRLRAIAA